MGVEPAAAPPLAGMMPPPTPAALPSTLPPPRLSARGGASWGAWLLLRRVRVRVLGQQDREVGRVMKKVVGAEAGGDVVVDGGAAAAAAREAFLCFADRAEK